MNAPDWKITGSLGLVVGLTLSGLSMVSRSGGELAVQAIELQDGQAAGTPGQMLLAVGGLASPVSIGGVPASATPSLQPAPGSTPAVVAPAVVTERPKATPRPTPRPTPKLVPVADDPDDCADDDCADDDPDETDAPDVPDDPGD
jgi:hypothetical protein